MQIHTPDADIADGEFPVTMNPGSVAPFGVIYLGQDTSMHLHSDEDCDRLIRAAFRIKEMRANTGIAHAFRGGAGSRGANCETCGLLQTSEVHAEPCGNVAPDSGRACTRAAGHDGGHQSGMIVWSRETARSAS
jgi:hypothetical protein